MISLRRRATHLITKPKVKIMKPKTYRKKVIVKKILTNLMRITTMMMNKRLDVDKTATVSFIQANVILKMNTPISLNMPKSATRTLQALIPRKIEKQEKQNKN